MGYNILTAFKATLNNMIGDRLRTSTTSLVEAATVEGFRFGHTFDVILSGGETKYFLYINPIGSDTTMALQERRFKSLDGGAEMEILWDVESYTAGPLEETFNQRNASGAGVVEISEIAPPTLGAGFKVRESDFLTGSGTGSHSSGDISSGTGFRLYEPGSYFIFKVTNLENNSANRVLVAYDWVELPGTVFVP